ncbi:MAG: hypothetical protein QOG73_2701, partial [Acetobacteraceae bacterium]|nr:hypothetical protein [Acetobacteraceae bacterium]
DWQQRRSTYGPEWKGFDEASTGLRANETAAAPNVPLPGETSSNTSPGLDPARRL